MRDRGVEREQQVVAKLRAAPLGADPHGHALAAVHDRVVADLRIVLLYLQPGVAVVVHQVADHAVVPASALLLVPLDVDAGAGVPEADVVLDQDVVGVVADDDAGIAVAVADVPTDDVVVAGGDVDGLLGAEADDVVLDDIAITGDALAHAVRIPPAGMARHAIIGVALDDRATGHDALRRAATQEDAAVHVLIEEAVEQLHAGRVADDQHIGITVQPDEQRSAVADCDVVRACDADMPAVAEQERQPLDLDP